MRKTKAYFKDLVYQINGAAIEVHKALGPGLLESVYHRCMVYELQKRDIAFQSELRIPIYYKDMEFDADLRCDLLVEKNVVVELKSHDKILAVHEAQLLTYMKLLQVPVGLMINFNCSHIFSEGQKTYVNDWYRILEDE